MIFIFCIALLVVLIRVVGLNYLADCNWMLIPWKLDIYWELIEKIYVNLHS